MPALLYDASRPSQLAPVVGQPQYTYPALTCFLGGARKDRALRQLFPDNPRRKVAGFNLQVDHRTQSSSRPIFFAEGDPHATPRPLGSEPPGSAEHVPLSWGQSHDPHTLDLLLARFLLPFAHVTCVFADDVGGLKGVRTLLQSWSLVGRDATYPLLRPRIIVVVETDEPSAETLLEDPAITPALFLPSGGPELFASVHVLSVPRGHTLSDEARFRTLKEEVLKAVDRADRDRLETHTQFSSVHLFGLLHKAVTHMAQNPCSPFNLIAASRPDQRPGEWTSHMIHYLCQSKTLMSAETQDLTIASSLLLEAFPPNTHGRWNAEDRRGFPMT